MATRTLSDAQIVKGGHLMIMLEEKTTVNDAETTKFVPIAFATSHTFSKTLNTNEISTKDHGDYAAVLPQNITWEATTENLYSLGGYKKLNDAFKQSKQVTVYFGETNYKDPGEEGGIVNEEISDNSWKKEGFGEQGKAYITSLQVTAAAGENATMNATFTGTGKLEDVQTLATDTTDNTEEEEEVTPNP